MSSMKPERYSSFLLKLTKFIENKVTKLQKEGKIEKIRAPYIREKLETFSYNEGNINYSSSFETVYKEEYEMLAFLKFGESFKKEQIFIETLDELFSSLGTNKTQAEFWLSRFVSAIIMASLEGETEERIMELTFSFIRDLEGAPNFWNPTIWLSGIWMIDDEVKIGKNLIFRKPIASDIQKEYDTRMLPMLPFL